MGNRREKKRNIRNIILGIIALVIVLSGCYLARNLYIKAKDPKAAEEAAETKSTAAATTEEIRKNCWEEKDGKSYYYGDDGQIVTGRFVLQEEKKIYYTDKDGAVTRVVDGTKPMIAITYDDGPSTYSAKLAAIFDKYDSAATFFEVGNRINEMPSLKEQEQAIADSNSELANHTYTHQNLTKVSKEKMIRQITKNEELLRSFGETADPILFRVPEGAVNDQVKKYCNAPIVLWSLDTLDWQSRNTKKVYKKARKAEDGDIVLMHSLYETTVKATKKLVPELIDKGYQLVTVTDLAEFRGGMENGVKYFSFPPVKEEAESSSETSEEAAADTSETTDTSEAAEE